MDPPGKRRRCKQTPVAEKIEKLKIWQANADWGPAEAARQLGANKSTLLGWIKALLDDKLSFIKEPDPDTGTFR
ncbi:hypothetical protein PR003_g12168 [Phytophthora rubi]|uniref:HTH psq-type domain-containing protein n=1 Tax=Phytophthora rubi TaxID=129364 RepID=A0A6A3NV15_9STRA|nr:hypothetical protein PR001_g5020 [Phytophthora rubi]KAE9046569.1 hypothetical protein PR002_g1592 [Phytophthora rubi]KAE9337101.1 hypothetical protein PR003_g12168 [Phytophthora rubi]